MKKLLRKKTQSIFILSILLGGILLSIVFSSKSYTNKEKQMLKIALPFDVRSLDVSSADDNNSGHVIGMLFEGLMRRDMNDQPKLAIAKSFEVSEDKKHYIFHLRDSQWSDGTAVTAYDFEFSWKRSLDPNSDGVTRGPYYFYPIKDAKRSLMGEISAQELSIRAIDNKTLSVELEYPAPYFLEVLTLPHLVPIPKHIVEKDPTWGSNENIVSNGPFKLKKWKKNNKIELVKNPSYWDKKNVQLDVIDISIVENNTTALAMYEQGALDWIGSPFTRMSYDTFSEVLAQEKEDVATYWFFVNTEKYPLNNKKLRQALSYAIDRGAIVENVFHNCGAPALSPLCSLLSLRTSPCFQDNNASVAKKLFAEALDELGISKEEFPEIELSYVADSEVHHRTAQTFQNQWRKILGIKNISLIRTEWAVHCARVFRGDYGLGFMGWSSCVLDPSFILEVFRNKDSASNSTRWENKRYQACLDQANLTIDPAERAKFLNEAEDILMDDMPVIPLYFINKRFAKNPKLKGENLSSLQFIDFKTAYFEK